MTARAATAAPPRSARDVAWRRRASRAADSFLVVLFSISCYLHLKGFVTEERYSSLFFAIEQSILVVIYLSRRRSYATSQRPADWIVATGGGWLVYAAQLGGSSPPLAQGMGAALQVVGIVLTIIGLCYLGRSFGIVAANRGLKVNGPYRFVRHPIYLSHLISLTGFLMANFTPFNVVLFLAVGAFQLMRIRAEERVLRESADYGAYMRRVRWRLVPGAY